MERKVKFGIDEYYHVYSRGVEKRNIFLEESDYSRFLKLLYIANSNERFHFRDVAKRNLSEIKRDHKYTSIGAYCLMPNHFHILFRETTENGISNMMEKALTGYAMYFNKKYNRVGPLFQSVFKAQHVNNDVYLRYLYAYIHLNPVKLIDKNWRERGAVDLERTRGYLKGYKFSSYIEYEGGLEREEKLILSKKDFPNYFSELDFSDMVEDWLTYTASSTEGFTEGSPR